MARPARLRLSHRPGAAAAGPDRDARRGVGARRQARGVAAGRCGGRQPAVRRRQEDARRTGPRLHRGAARRLPGPRARRRRSGVLLVRAGPRADRSRALAARRAGGDEFDPRRRQPRGARPHRAEHTHLRGLERRAVGQRGGGGAGVTGGVRRVRPGADARRHTGVEDCRGLEQRRARRRRGRPHRRNASATQRRHIVFRDPEDRSLRNPWRHGQSMAAPAEPAWPPEQRRRAALVERPGRHTPQPRHVDRGLWCGHAQRRCCAVRGALRLRHRARQADAGGQARSADERVLLAVPVVAARAAPGDRRSAAVHRHAGSRQAPLLRVAGPRGHRRQEPRRHRPRRRHQLRRPAQPAARTLVAAPVYLAGQGQRPALHADDDLRDLPLPGRPHPRRHRPPAHRGAARWRGHPGRAAGGGAPSRRGHRARREGACRPARALAQPARVDRARARARAAGHGHIALPRAHRRQARPRA